MTSIIKLRALSGASDESPPCYILHIDEFRFMLDCGWDEKFDERITKQLKRYCSQIDAVLLSYPDPLHLGALPYAVGKCDLNCPIYATVPVYKMGQMFMYDWYQSRYSMEDFNLFTLDDVDMTFDRITQLKYNQNVSLKGKGFGITITPLAAGHMIGGTVWKIVKEGEEDIIYAADYNHKKERHLNSCELEKIPRPSLLITDTYNALYQQARRRIRDEKLMTNILQTLRNGGNVLIAVDTAGRVLELIHMLDQLWRNKDSGLLAYSLALLNNVSYNVVEFAKSQIEWMSDKLIKSFEGARNNPFQFKHVKLCHSLLELSKVSSPKVVLASMPDMECGYSRELFLQWASKPNNSIIITNRTSPGTLARKLIDISGKPASITLEIKKRVPLEGKELEEYESAERENKVITEDTVELSSDSEEEIVQLKGKHDLMVKPVSTQQKLMKTKKRWPLFPFFEEKIKFDDYGEFMKEDECKVIDISSEFTDSFVNTKAEEEEEDMQIDITEVPTKCVTYTNTINVEAQIQYIDFEGRSDGESIKKIITNMKPRRVLLVRGSQESMRATSEYCKQFIDAKIYTAKLNGIVDVTMESHIYQVRLTDSLLSSIDVKKCKDGEISWIDARLAVKETDEEMEGETIDLSEDNPEVRKKLERVVTLEPVPLHEVVGHQPTFVNELKLSDFKQVLSKHNISTEMLGGVLYCCDGTVAVRRIEQGKVVLEGCLSDDFYKIRELLYDQYAVV